MMDRPEHAFDAQRRFIANASHELRTPLAVAGTAIDVVLAKPDRRPDQLGPWPATSERPYTEPNDSSTDSR
jgi:signal transduction histidine kinase